MKILGIEESALRANKPVFLFTGVDAKTGKPRDVYVKVASIAQSEAWLEKASIVEDAEAALRGAMAGSKMAAAFGGQGKRGSEVASKRGSGSAAVAAPAASGNDTSGAIDMSRLNEDAGDDGEDLVYADVQTVGDGVGQDRVNAELQTGDDAGGSMDGMDEADGSANRPYLSLAEARAAFQGALFDAVQSYPGLEDEDLGVCSWSQIMGAFWLLKGLSDPFDFSQAMTEAVTDRQLGRIPAKALEKAIENMGNPGSSSR